MLSCSTHLCTLWLEYKDLNPLLLMKQVTVSLRVSRVMMKTLKNLVQEATGFQ